MNHRPVSDPHVIAYLSQFSTGHTTPTSAPPSVPLQPRERNVKPRIKVVAARKANDILDRTPENQEQLIERRAHVLEVLRSHPVWWIDGHNLMGGLRYNLRTGGPVSGLINEAVFEVLLRSRYWDDIQEVRLIFDNRNGNRPVVTSRPGVRLMVQYAPRWRTADDVLIAAAKKMAAQNILALTNDRGLSSSLRKRGVPVARIGDLLTSPLWQDQSIGA